MARQKHALLREPDVSTIQWERSQGLAKAQQRVIAPMWRASLRGCNAWLDRMWYHPSSLVIPELEVRWLEIDTLFDHAQVMIRLPQMAAGAGFAGGSREREYPRRPPRCKVDIPELKKKRNEWINLVQDKLTPTPPAEHLESFEALQTALRVADGTAQEIVP